MPRIVNNRICFNDHNVVCSPEFYNTPKHPDYMGCMLDMQNQLSPHGRAGAHRRELSETMNSGEWTIELPTISLQAGYATKPSPTRPESYTLSHILCSVMLHNGNYPKLLFIGSYPAKDGFKPIWLAMYQQGIKIGKAQRRVAEAHYVASFKSAIGKGFDAPPLVDTTL